MTPSTREFSGWRYPAAVWALVLGSVFAAEAGTHMLMHYIFPANPPQGLDAALDAILVTTVLAPLLWFVLVRPLRQAARVRADFVANLLSSIEADRRRMARELHDGVGQSLTMLVSGLKSAREDAAGPESVRRSDELRQLAISTLADVKRLSLGLRPSLLDDLGLGPALERVVADVRENHPIDVTIEFDPAARERLPAAIETALFRIVQEALANVVKHARASKATVAVRRDDRNLVVEIKDDGAGIPAAALRGQNPGHLGLTGMRERATHVGGALTIHSAPGAGTRIVTTIPLGG